MTESGDYREELYYRLNTLSIELPPLRERAEDIPELCRYFTERSCRELGKTLLGIEDSVIEQMKKMYWKGNVRELKNFCRFVVEFYEHIDNEIILDEFENHKKRNKNLLENSNNIKYPIHHHLLDSNNIFQALQAFEKLFIKHHLEIHLGRVSRTAKAIGLDRTTLYKKMNKYGITIL